MLSIKGLLGINILQCLVITMQNKLFMQEIVFLMLEGSNHSIKFLIIRAPFLVCIIQLSTEILKGAAILSEDSA